MTIGPPEELSLLHRQIAAELAGAGWSNTKIAKVFDLSPALAAQLPQATTQLPQDTATAPPPDDLATPRTSTRARLTRISAPYGAMWSHVKTTTRVSPDPGGDHVP